METKSSSRISECNGVLMMPPEMECCENCMAFCIIIAHLSYCAMPFYCDYGNNNYMERAH